MAHASYHRVLNACAACVKSGTRSRARRLRAAERLRDSPTSGSNFQRVGASGR